MSTTCNSYRSTVCRSGLQTVDNTCSCLNYQLSPPFVSFGSTGMESDFGSYVAGATLPLTPVAQTLIQERTSLVRGDGQLVGAKTNQLPCGPGTKPCARTKSCVPADAPSTMWPQAPYN